MFWVLPAAALALFLLAAGGKKKGGKVVHPKAGQTWVLGICASQPLGPEDYRRWFAHLADTDTALVRGVQDYPGAKNCYLVTLLYKTDTSVLVGQKFPVVGGWIKILNATRSPVASPF